jgi:GTP pyrophosphokinase
MPTGIDQKIIQSNYRNLLKSCKNIIGESDHVIIRKAYDLAVETYGDRLKETGEPFITHAVEVARIGIQEMGLTTVSIVSILLHDIIKHASYDESEIERQFGKQVRDIVSNLTKISRLSSDRTSLNAENFILFLLTLSDDVRVILIKLADSLHYMRTIEQLPADVHKKIVGETSHLYAPIAHRLGLYNLKTELEERYLKYAHPEVYHVLEQKLKETVTEREDYISKFIKPIEGELDKSGFTCVIKGRSKSISSIWNKMKKQNVDFEEVYDLFAIRIISDKTIENDRSDCWKIYSIVTNIYPPNPKRLRDWITSPKVSGYESLHTTVLGPGGKWVEIQIRTRRMDDIAEEGGAAHWRYKESAFGPDKDGWMSSIREKLKDPFTYSSDRTDASKGELYSHDIFVFTPTGDLKKLPAGSTVLDFAYQIHTTIGNTCTGAKVNGKFVTLKHGLKNGDQVEILTLKSQTPHPEWLNFVASARSKAKIKRALNELAFHDANAGKDMLIRKLNQLKLSFGNETINKLLEYFKLDNPLEFYHNLANGIIDLAEVKNCFEPPSRAAEEINQPEISKPPVVAPPSVDLGGDLLIIDGNADLKDYKFSKCCKPVYGDDVFGFITVGKGIKIHRIDCPNAVQMREKFNYRIIKAKWLKSSDTSPHMATLKVSGNDELGLINKISDLISIQLKLNLRSISFSTRGSKFEGIIKVYVRDANQLDFLVRRLMKVKSVQKVTRAVND